MASENEPETFGARQGASVVIDLTEATEPETRGDDLQENATDPQIKTENRNESPVQAIHEQSERIDIPMHDYCALPDFDVTPLPDIIEEVKPSSDPNTTDELTSESMAGILQTFDSNKFKELSAFQNLDSEDEDAEAKHEFQQLKEQYENRQRTAGVTFWEKVEFQKAADQEAGRVRARAERKQYDRDALARLAQDEPMFVPEEDESTIDLLGNRDRSIAANVSANDSSDEGISGGASKEALRSTKTKKGEKKISNTPKISKNKKGSAKTTRGSKRKKEQQQQAHASLNDLIHHDIIAEANANQDAAQPQFTSKNRKDALAQLISSIPAEQRNLYAGEKADFNQACKAFNGRAAIKSDGNNGWKLKGMKSSLKSYQVLGIAWMREREGSTKQPRGGILSDDMGLGKTVSALANIVDGCPLSTHSGPIATLIVVPPSIMSQWLSEVDKHVELRKVMIYRSKMKFLDPEQELGDQHIVITSYHEIARSLPKNNPPPELFTAEAKAEWWKTEVEQNRGPLHRIYWHRIILDEAQAIKNHLSRTSEAVCLLKGRFRWCLSGTPVQNSLEEFYPFFKFLKFECTGDFELFKRNFAKKGSAKATQRLQACLSKIMLRRTHADKLFGAPILKLPPIKPMETIEVKFNTVERALYRIVKHRFVAKVRALSPIVNVKNSYQHIFVLLLRLRQLVGHPLLIQQTLRDLLETEDLERLWHLTDVVDSGPAEGSTETGGDKETAHALRAAISASQQPGAPVVYPGSSSVWPRDNALSVAFRKCLDGLREDGSWAKANARALCCACGNPPTGAHVSSCLHLYCYACMNDLYFREVTQKKSCAECIECGAKMYHNEAYVAKGYDDVSQCTGARTRLSPDEDIDWYTNSGPILRSAKIKGAVAKIKYWFQQDPTNKIIVFSQFRGMIRVMERVCREEAHWGYASYHGTMAFDHRDEQVKKFTHDPECRILLAAMKAGGVGLNLTAANRVIILDLWWNVSVESQAFTRCFRIGQKRDVEVVRFVVQDSVDTDIVRMQNRKVAEIEKVMDERQRKNNLTTRELIELFYTGPEGDDDNDNKPDDGGHPQVFEGEDEPFILPFDHHAQQNAEEDA